MPPPEKLICELLTPEKLKPKLLTPSPMQTEMNGRVGVTVFALSTILRTGVEEWIVQLVQGMYANARSHMRIVEGYSEEFEVKVGVHQGSVLSSSSPCHTSSALGSPGRTSMPMTLLSLVNRSRNVSGGS